jgi:hypothetical protein
MILYYIILPNNKNHAKSYKYLSWLLKYKYKTFLILSNQIVDHELEKSIIETEMYINKIYQ